jgi:hypothetical protein
VWIGGESQARKIFWGVHDGSNGSPSALAGIQSPHLRSVGLAEPPVSGSRFWDMRIQERMFNLQRAGGIAALVEALAYVVGFVVMATLLNPGDTEGWSPAQRLAFLLERKAIFQTWMIFVYVLFGVVLVFLAVALHERLKAKFFDLMKIATPLGLIWAGLVIASGMVASVGLEAVATLHSTDVAQATSAWVTIAAVQDGLGGGVEIVGGLWVILISAASFHSKEFPTALNLVGIIVGLAGVLTVVPSFGELGAVFGLGQILWFAWIGIIMLRRPQLTSV